MNDLEYESTLVDRIAKIQAINKQYDLEHNGYISFSGGKDSVVNHYLFDLALPDNHIPRVFINTGVEYRFITEYVKERAKQDYRFIIINSGVNIKKMLEADGYPFKSKQHSHNWMIYKNNEQEASRYFEMIDNNKNLLNDVNFISQLPKGIKTNVKYVYGIREKELPIRNTECSVRERERALSTSIKNCPDLLKYQFEGKLSFKISDKCCYRLKKEIAKKWQISYNKSIVITGIRAEEGGMRNQGGCTVFDGKDLHKFHPIKIVSDEWEDEFIKRNNIKLCKLYYPPYNFKRTGCKGCPFNKDVASELLTMKKLLPNEYKQCLHLWKPVYDEYVRLGYRLSKDFYDIKPQYTIEDYLGEEYE